MKKLLFILLLISASTAFAQSTYAYDASGNRISRTITLSGSSAAPKNTNNTDETVEQPQYSDQIGELEFAIYPNPTKGEIHIKNPTEVAGQIQLFDPQGRMLSETPCKQGDNTIDLYTRPQGMYILRVVSNGKMVNWKIVKE
jgi:YD repeat-containing protein